MTDNDKKRDVKQFSEFVKNEILVRLPNYENYSMGASSIFIQTAIEDLQYEIKQTCYHSKLAYPDVIKAAVALAAQALVLACNAQRELDAWEEMRA